MPFRLIPALIAALAATPALADGCASGDGTQLEVSVQNVRSSSGTVTITVYGDERSEFLARGAKLVRDRVPAVAGVTRGCLPVPGPGVYAIAIYHDEDGDRDFDRNAMGLPKEGYGFSNDAPTRMSLPSFGDVVFRAGAGTTPLTITMRY
ncbi:MAG: DUF2141 domain-containing protein [Pseudomonadota bacterium]